MKTRANIKPYLSSIPIMYLALWGKIAARIREPSNGGRGTRLNTARTKLVMITIDSAMTAGSGSDEANPLITKPATTANIIFDRGPAKATSASPFFPDLRALKFTGTGFAHPRMIPPGKIAQNRGNIIEPNGSICFIGFRVRRPMILAVWSPWLSAASPWATS